MPEREDAAAKHMGADAGHETLGRAVEWEGGAVPEGDDEDEDDLASDVWDGDGVEPDWTQAEGCDVPLSDEEVVAEDDDDAEPEGEEEEEGDDDDGFVVDQDEPAQARIVPTPTGSDRSSESQRSSAATEEATGTTSDWGDRLAEGVGKGCVATARAEGVVGVRKASKLANCDGLNLADSAEANRPKRARPKDDARWGGDGDGDGDLKTTTIDFSLAVDLRKTPELLCKSKDRVPLFKLTASGSYNCTRNAFRRAGFKQTKGDNFSVLWGMALKLPEFKLLREYQRVNHFPGTYLLGRKDNMARFCNRFRRTFGPENFEYFPKTFICPADRAELLADEAECKAKAKRGEEPMWIVKPPAGCKGIGIRLVTDPSTQIKERAVVVVSRYIDRPLLINKTKFDLRLYVAVTCFNPLRVYLHEQGLARFCTAKYSVKTRKDRFRHLTNYSLNKKNPDFKRAEGEAEDDGHKWSVRAVWQHLEQEGVDTAAIKERINDVVVKTLLAVETQISTNMQLAVPHRNNCFELFGFDIILDEDYKPWLVEVNTALSLATDAALDKKIKNQVVTELLHMLRIQCYDRKKLEERLERDKNDRLTGQRPSGKNGPSNAENAKRSFQRRDVCSGKKNALEELTEDDVKILDEIEDEFARRGAYRRIFPQNNEQMHKWMQLFEVKRFYNILQYHWITRPGEHQAQTPKEFYDQQTQSHAGTTAMKRMQAASARVPKARALPGSGPQAPGIPQLRAMMPRQASPSQDKGRGDVSPARVGSMTAAKLEPPVAEGGNILVSDFMEWMHLKAPAERGGVQQRGTQNVRARLTLSRGVGSAGGQRSRPSSGSAMSASPMTSPPLSPTERFAVSERLAKDSSSAAGGGRLVPHGGTTCAPPRQRMGPPPAAPRPMQHAREEQLIKAFGGGAGQNQAGQGWAELARFLRGKDGGAKAGEAMLPAVGSPRERGYSARPQSPTGAWLNARAHTQEQQHHHNASAAIGLQGMRMGSGSAQASRALGETHAGWSRIGNSRYVSARPAGGAGGAGSGQGAGWHDNPIGAASHAADSLRPHSKPPRHAGIPLNPGVAGIVYESESHRNRRQRSRGGRGAALSRSGSSDAEASVTLEDRHAAGGLPLSGLESSPRTGDALRLGACDKSIRPTTRNPTYAGRDSLQNPAMPKKIGLQVAGR